MKISDGIKSMVTATGNALNNMRTASGKSADPSVVLYESLTPDVIDQMANDLGADVVLDYIKEMEAKRLQPHK